MRAAKDESDKLDELIVPAPEMLKAEMCRLKNELDEVAHAKKDKMAALAEMRQRQDYIDKYDTELTPMIERARLIEKQLVNIK